MVKICVINAEGLKDDKEKVEGLPAPEVVTDIPLYEKLELETLDDLATIKNPKRRCKGLVIILVLGTMAIACLCFATLVYTINDDNKDQEVVEHQETQRFEFEITFRDPVDATEEHKPKQTTVPYRSTINPLLHHMKEEIIVDVENNTEVFTIPPSDENEALVFLHDFTHRYTAYLLVEQDLCFVKKLNPLLLNPFILLQLLLNPIYFSYEFTASRESFIAIPPPMDSLLRFGPEVDILCGDAVTFWLEEMDDEYETVDISELPWSDWGHPDRYNRRKRSANEPIKTITFLDADELVHHADISFKKPASI